MCSLLVQVTFSFELLSSDAVRFVPVQLGQADSIVLQVYAGDPLALAPCSADPLLWALAGVDCGEALGAAKDGLKCVRLLVVQFVQDVVGVFESALATEFPHNLGDVCEFVS